MRCFVLDENASHQVYIITLCKQSALTAINVIIDFILLTIRTERIRLSRPVCYNVSMPQGDYQTKGYNDALYNGTINMGVTILMTMSGEQ